ncbi:unnamed protein product [Lampetra planeri]
MAGNCHVERGTGRHKAQTPGDGAEDSGENGAGAAIGAGAGDSGRETRHMVGAILSSEAVGAGEEIVALPSAVCGRSGHTAADCRGDD